ncbi:MAG: MFS transporter [Polaromonas sp.]|uniref:MFS transporter n=1 Tax=Polaromonas sp. TaxID=1869339 RepID=UPI0025F3077C|nr:MFS transporter [Polaromonas sp.]MBI2726529.1 MFS transporter [Polaromonas sp.]
MKQKSLLGNPWWIVFGSFLGLIVGNITIYQFSFSVLIKPITTEFGWSRGMASSAILVAALFAAIGTPIVGWLIDRHGIKRITLGAIVLFGLATMSMSVVSSSYALFIALFAVLGLFSAGQAPLPYAKAISATFDAKRGLALGIAMTGVGIGAALMPRIAQELNQSIGWRGAFIGLGLTVMVIALPAVAIFLREPVRSGKSGALALPGLTASEALKSKVFWILAGAFISIPIVANGVIVHLIPLLTDRGVPTATAVNVFASIGASLIIGRLLSGYLLDKFFGPNVAIAFVVMPAIGLVLLATTSDERLSLLGAVLVGLGLGAEVDLIGYLQSRYLGLRSFGQVYGYLFAIFTVGGGIGPFVMGMIFDRTGSYRPALIGFFCLLCVVVILLTRLGKAYPFPVEEKPDDTPRAPILGGSRV